MASTRDRLVAATNKLFRRQGYNGTGLKMTASESCASPRGKKWYSDPVVA